MKERIYSIDVFRGITMIFIVGFAHFVITICNLFPGEISNYIILHMSHADWNGLRHHDTLFPTFIFIAGMSFPFSYSKQIAQKKSKSDIYRKIIIRVAILIALGIVYNGFFNLDFEHLRYASVLGRIGIAWMFAAVIFINFKRNTRISIAVVILVIYWLISAFIPAPDAPQGAGIFSMEGCFAGYVDRKFLPGRLYKTIFDPEGILSAIPAIVTAMLGMFTGDYIQKSSNNSTKKSVVMAVSGIILFLLGMMWNIIYPVNKALWSSSFVLAVGGYSLFLYAILYYIIDVRGCRRWAFFLEVIGLNSITIYLGQEICDFSSISKFFFSGLANIFNESVASAIMSGSYLLVIWMFLYFLYRQKIFLKV